METKTYYADPKRIQWKWFGTCLLLCFGIVSFILPRLRDNPTSLNDWAIIGAFAAILFGLVSIIPLTYLPYRGRKKPILVVDSDGVDITGPGLRIGRIPWSAIESTYVRSYNQNMFIKVRYLCFKLKHTSDNLKIHRSPWQDLMIRSSLPYTDTPVFLIDELFETSMEDVQLEIENKLYERRKQQDANGSWFHPDHPAEQPLRVGNR